MKRALGLVLVIMLPLSACEKVTRKVTAQVSPCFKVLPQAHAAVDGQGTFVDVTRIRGTGATTFPHRTTHDTTTTAPMTPTTVQRSRDVCVVAYRADQFDTARIQHLIGANRSGSYALVVVSVRTQRVRVVILVDQLPKPLRKH
jgi:hypothetical protein